MKKTDIIKAVEENAVEYKKNLMNKFFLILAKSDKNIIPIKVSFYAENYMHLTGLLSNQNSKDFFDSCINKTLNSSNISYKYNKKTVEFKVLNLPLLVKIHKIATSIGDYNGSKLNLNTDKVIGSKYKGNDFSLGLLSIQNGKYYVPNSLLKEEPTSLMKKPFMPIVAILSRDIDNSNNLYDTITYKSKNINIENLHFPYEVRKLITMDVLSELKPLSADTTKNIHTNNISKPPKIEILDSFEFTNDEEIATTLENDAKTSDKKVTIKSLKDVMRFFTNLKNKDSDTKNDELQIRHQSDVHQSAEQTSEEQKPYSEAQQGKKQMNEPHG